MVRDYYHGREVTSGFLIEVRFPYLYEKYAPRYDSRRDWYAIPRVDRPWTASAVKYRGLDRDALDANDVAPTHLVELFLADLEKSDRCNDGLLSSLDDVAAVMKWLGEGASQYDVLWIREVGGVDAPPSGFSRLGVDPAYFLGDHFSASCDCMMFPRWHGSDEAGTLFLDHFRRLNPLGLFDTPDDAKRFLDFYVSLDWTENEASDYSLIEVFGRPE